MISVLAPCWCGASPRSLAETSFGPGPNPTRLKEKQSLSRSVSHDKLAVFVVVNTLIFCRKIMEKHQQLGAGFRAIGKRPHLQTFASAEEPRTIRKKDTSRSKRMWRGLALSRFVIHVGLQIRSGLDFGGCDVALRSMYLIPKSAVVKLSSQRLSSAHVRSTVNRAPKRHQGGLGVRSISCVQHPGWCRTSKAQGHKIRCRNRPTSNVVGLLKFILECLTFGRNLLRRCAETAKSDWLFLDSPSPTVILSCLQCIQHCRHVIHCCFGEKSPAGRDAHYRPLFATSKTLDAHNRRFAVLQGAIQCVGNRLAAASGAGRPLEATAQIDADNDGGPHPRLAHQPHAVPLTGNS